VTRGLTSRSVHLDHVRARVDLTLDDRGDFSGPFAVPGSTAPFSRGAAAVAGDKNTRATIIPLLSDRASRYLHSC